MKNKILALSKSLQFKEYILNEIRIYVCPCCGRRWTDNGGGIVYDSAEDLIKDIERIPVSNYDIDKLSIEDDILIVDVKYALPEFEFDEELEPVCIACKEAELKPSLDDYTKEQLLIIAAARNVTPTELIENFIADLTHSDKSNGSDERDLAEQWLDRVIWK